MIRSSTFHLKKNWKRKRNAQCPISSWRHTAQPFCERFSVGGQKSRHFSDPSALSGNRIIPLQFSPPVTNRNGQNFVNGLSTKSRRRFKTKHIGRTRKSLRAAVNNYLMIGQCRSLQMTSLPARCQLHNEETISKWKSWQSHSVHSPLLGDWIWLNSNQLILYRISLFGCFVLERSISLWSGTRVVLAHRFRVHYTISVTLYILPPGQILDIKDLFTCQLALADAVTFQKRK